FVAVELYLKKLLPATACRHLAQLQWPKFVGKPPILAESTRPLRKPQGPATGASTPFCSGGEGPESAQLRRPRSRSGMSATRRHSASGEAIARAWRGAAESALGATY